MQLRGNLAVDPLAQPKDGRPMQVGRKSLAQPEDATPRESGVGRRGNRTIYIRRKPEVDRAGEPRFNVQLYCDRRWCEARKGALEEGPDCAGRRSS